jgi:hypothetical protein
MCSTRMRHIASIIGAEQLEDLVEDDADALSSKLGTVALAYSHKADDEVRVIRWDATEDHDFYHINRPSSYDEMRAEINKQTPLAPTDKLYFFPYSQIDTKASKKRKFDEITFAEWLSLEKFPYMLPAVWIYKGEKSPTTSPHKLGDRTSIAEYDVRSVAISTGTQGTLRKRMLTMCNECMFPGCNVKSSDYLDYCHILPKRLEKLPDEHIFLLQILGRAFFEKQQLSSLENGMLLCKNHHAAFDRYAWTVDAKWNATFSTYDNICRVKESTKEAWITDGHEKPMKTISGTTLAWQAYDEYIFRDNGARISDALKDAPAAPSH